MPTDEPHGRREYTGCHTGLEFPQAEGTLARFMLCRDLGYPKKMHTVICTVQLEALRAEGAF